VTANHRFCSQVLDLFHPRQLLRLAHQRHIRWRAISGRLQVVVKKNRRVATAPFIVGGCTPCLR
jgi:hypothetical protein